MKRIVEALVDQGLKPAEARNAALSFVAFLQKEVYSGKRVDLGFLSITPRRKPPVEIRMNLNGPNKGTRYCIGEQQVWSVRMFGSWLKKYRPAWSRF